MLGWRQALLATLTILWGVPAHAETDYPKNSVTLIASFPAGQATDIAARLLADALSKQWDVPVVVLNQGGALGIPAMMALKTAAKDGYTLGIGTTGTLATNSYLVKSLPYAPLTDYTPAAAFFTAPLVVLASNSAPFKTLPELLAYAKSKPNAINWAIPGNGSAQHVAGERIFQQAGVTLQRIPYKGSVAAIQDLVGGNVMLMTDSLSASLALIESGKVRALAVTTAERVPQLPNTPTVAESGFPGFSAYGWGGILAPAGTPAPIVKKISDAVYKVLDDPAFQKKLMANAFLADRRSPEQWHEFVKTQIEITDRTLSAAGLPRG